MKRNSIVWLSVLTFVTGLFLFRSSQPELNKGIIAESPHKISQAVDDQEKASIVNVSDYQKPENQAASSIPLPSSLQDTEFDGGVLTDLEGQVILDQNLRRLFDYLLSSVGELNLDQIHALLKEHLVQQLSFTQAQQVLDLFQRYVQYLDAVGQMTGSDLLARHESIKILRRNFFDENLSEAFFGIDEQYADYTIERMLIESDKNLSESEKTRLFNELEAQMPSRLLETQLNATQHHQVISDTRILDEIGANQTQRFDFRAEVYGEDVATRLAQLDTERQNWLAQKDYYLQHRAAIEVNAELNQTQRSSALIALFKGMDEAQIRRLEAAWRISTHAD